MCHDRGSLWFHEIDIVKVQTHGFIKSSAMLQTTMARTNVKSDEKLQTQKVDGHSRGKRCYNQCLWHSLLASLGCIREARVEYMSKSWLPCETV
jgi:hypothetical protein